MKKTFFAGSWISIILTLISFTLFAFVVFWCVKSKSIDFVGIIIFCVYRILFSHFFGIVVFNKNGIRTFNDFIWRNARFQFNFKINYEDVIAIEYACRDYNSIGKLINNQRRGTIGISYLEITCKDGSIRRIMLNKFNFSQWCKMHQIIINHVVDVLVINTPQDLRKFVGYR